MILNNYLHTTKEHRTVAELIKNQGVEGFIYETMNYNIEKYGDNPLKNI
ncbi:MAG: hypothetical protein LBU32_23990 [Clostridiales bacterium]|nr:hypothetical protein [Clostridiales bacterium]